MAILVGDLAFVYADEMFLQATVPSASLLDAFRRFTTLREEVMAGQTLDVHAATSGSTDRLAALTVATLKSGRYSVARPLEIGALLAGATAELVDGLGAFGDPLGRAFQVRDDLLGVFGDDATTGKSTASDLAEGKRTLLIAEAVAGLDASDRRELLAGLGDPTLDAARTDRLRELIELSGARAATESYIEVAVADARQVLDHLDIPAGVRTQLAQVASYLGDRTR
jgi:geranylgeranyl diphosphate synthase type I